jgi:pimeloyl-ACP methyl ester carboxylesterase
MAASYRLDRHFADINAVADACGAERFLIWGWSLGATLGLQFAEHSTRLRGAVIAGSYFGRIFTDEYVLPILNEYEPIASARVQGRLDKHCLSLEQRDLMRHTKLPVFLARWRGLHTWPGVEPNDLRCPALVYSGTADSPTIVRKLEEQRVSITAAGVRLCVFEGLNHLQLITSDTVALPVVLPFLRQLAAAH